jgi:outer membrane receptor protein involved in Fe transport
MKYIYVIMLLMLCLALEAQVSGRVVDEERNPLPGASVVLKQAQEIKAGAVTLADGSFTLEADPGSYDLEISFIAFQNFNQEITVKASQKSDLGEIILRADAVNLNEVVVESKANLMEFQQDKRVFNVAADLSSVGSNASDILNNVPSVSVDIEGNVSLRGSNNVRILVDGKPSGLIGSDPATALRLIPANMIEKIEVMTNPSARYEAEGEAGIINIVLKKEQRGGFNGNFDVSAGYPENYSATAGVNYRAGKINWFSNASIGYRRSPGGGFTEQFYDGPDTNSRSYITRDQNRGGMSGTFRFGADYTIAPKQTLTGSFVFRKSRGLNYADITYDDYNADELLISRTIRNDDELEEEQRLEGDLHWEKEFDNKDHKWTADFSFQDNDDRESSDIYQDTVLLNGMVPNDAVILQKVSNQEDEQNIIIRTDYVHPFGEKKSFEVGARAGIRNIINNYSVEEKAPGGEFVSLPAFTDNFRYIENIYAAYGIYNDVIGKDITYQLGLRTEYTDIATIAGEENRIDKEYINFFPSAFFTYKINPVNDIQLNYSRRISRPWFRLLLPFSNYSDPRNFWTGNPDLDPEYTDSYEAGFVHYWENASLYSGLYYRHRTGVIERIRRLDSVVNGVSYTSRFPINLAVQDAYGFEFNLNYDVTEWYTLNANLNIFYAVTSGNYEDIDYGNTNFTSTGRLTNRVSFWESDLQLSYNFRAPQTTSQGRDLAINSLDIAWSRDILKGNGTITLSVRDMFNSRRRRSYTSGDDWNAYSEFQWRQRQFLVSFSYRINQKKQRGGGRGGDFDGGDF